MPGTVAIIQSSYIPWRGYFAMIARCQAFVFLDSVQFTRRDWRTRNRIKMPSGPAWLTIPVKQKGNFHASIDAIEVADPAWSVRHLRSIEQSYRRAAWFPSAYPLLSAAYDAIAEEASLSEVNRDLTGSICRMLRLDTKLYRDVDLLPRETLDKLDPTTRLVRLAAAAGGTQYLSGPSARSYLDEALFRREGLEVVWMDYTRHLAPYGQLWGAFDPAVSIVDPLLNLGAEAARALLFV